MLAHNPVGIGRMNVMEEYTAKEQTAMGCKENLLITRHGQ